MPTEYKVVQEIESQYKLVKDNFLVRHRPVALKSGFACTFDFSQAGPDYGVVTFHYIDDSWKFCSFVLDFTPYPMDVTKEMDHVADFVCELLVQNGINEDSARKAPIVTDQAWNMRGIGNFGFLKNDKLLFLETRLDCACHVLNTIAKRVTEPYVVSGLSTQVKQNCKLVQAALNNVQKIIVKLRGFTAVRESLGTALFVPGDTR